MTKPRNFPERVNRRRKRAHDRLMKRAAAWSPADEREVLKLEERIVVGAGLRHVRTKRDRSGGSSRTGRKSFAA